MGNWFYFIFLAAQSFYCFFAAKCFFLAFLLPRVFYGFFAARSREESVKSSVIWSSNQNEGVAASDK